MNQQATDLTKTVESRACAENGAEAGAGAGEAQAGRGRTAAVRARAAQAAASVQAAAASWGSVRVAETMSTQERSVDAKSVAKMQPIGCAAVGAAPSAGGASETLYCIAPPTLQTCRAATRR